MYYIDTIILILLLIEKSAQKLIVPEKTSNPISECIIYILNKYFNNSMKISIKYSNEHSTIAFETIRKIDYPIMVNADEPPKIHGIDTRTPDDVSVIINESINISVFLNNTKRTPQTQFLVILTKNEAIEFKMTEIFLEFWKNNIVNVLILVTDNSDIQIYTFIPYNPHDCAVHKPVLLARWTSRGITPRTDIIQKERVKNLNGCTLNASVMDIPPSIVFPNEDYKLGVQTVNGVEGSTLMELSKRMNFKLNFLTPKDWGRIKPVPYGAIGDVFFKKSHFASGRFANTWIRYKNLDLSVPVSCGIECLSWAVPMGAKKAQPQWITLLITGFGNNVWFFITIATITAIVAFRVLSKGSNIDRYIFNGTVKTIFYIVRSSLGPSTKIPKRLYLRIIFITWLLYTFVISTAYQALLGSKLTVPFAQPNIDTLKDLLESDLQITGLLSTFKLVTDDNEDKIVKEMENRYVGANFNFREGVEKIVSGQRMGYLWTSTTTLMYTVIQHPDAKEKVHFMKQCGHIYYPTMLMQKNSPLTAKVNRIIRTLSEAGILCKWRNDYLYNIPQVDPPVQKLSLNRMIGSFVILVAGLGAALIVFVAENIQFWFSSTKNIRNIKNVRCIRKSGRPKVFGVTVGPGQAQARVCRLPISSDQAGSNRI